jgi:hypothetical protein
MRREGIQDVKKPQVAYSKPRVSIFLMPRSSRPAFADTCLMLLLLALALGHGLLATLAMDEKSTTSDEIAHITGGYTFNHWNDYRLHPENGLLPQRWQSLPMVLAGAKYPNQSGQDWATSHVWMLGYVFFYQEGNNLEWMLATARAMNACFGLATVLLVAWWAWHFFAGPGAIVAAVLCVLSPSMLAHSGLATSDMAMTFFLLAAASAWWWHLHDGRRRVWLLSAVSFGLACVAKYTAVLLLPIFTLMMIVRTVSSAPLPFFGRTFPTRLSRLGVMTASLAGQGLVAVLVIWAFCGFRYVAFNPVLPPGDFIVSWDHVLSIGSAQAAVIKLFRNWHLLPEGFLYGFAYTLKSVEARGAFLDGTYSLTGWVSFFPKAFLYKTAPSLLVALAVAAGLVLLRMRAAGLGWLRPHLYRATPLLVLFAVYWGFSLTSRLNIGHRHILPTYPVLFIFCGTLGWAAVRAWRQSRLAGVALSGVVAALLGWQVAIAAGIHPHYLAYFSPLVGGSTQGYKHLVDSSLDWGQDLPGLKHWLNDHRRVNEPVYLSYFGTGEPDHYGIQAVRMPGLFHFRRVHPWYWPEPGIYAISATMLSHVYSPLRGDWTTGLEKRYQALRQSDTSFRALKQAPRGHPELMKDTSPEAWATMWDEYNQLRFARLCHYLRVRPPDDNIGYSILIYRLTADEIAAATAGTLSDWAQLIERTVEHRP